MKIGVLGRPCGARRGLDEVGHGKFFEVSGINCSIENPSFVAAVVSAAQFKFSRPRTAVLFLHFHDFLRFSYRNFYLLPL
jgi:hypothetical protein